MTLIEFLHYHTKVGELCVIKNEGWIVTTCWIDNEDLFMIPETLRDKQVINERWGQLPIVNQQGVQIKIPCHYIIIQF